MQMSEQLWAEAQRVFWDAHDGTTADTSPVKSILAGMRALVEFCEAELAAAPSSPPDRLPVPGAAEVPGRLELAKALYEAYWGPEARRTRAQGGVLTGTWEQLGDESRDAYLSEADYVLSLLARRPATDEAEALRKRLEASELDYANECDRARRQEARQDQRIADIESQLASVTAERDGFLAQVGYDSLADVELDFLEWTSMKRERDEALAKLAKAGELEEARLRAQRDEIDRLREQLAARPEPLVIDEALAERVRDVYISTDGGGDEAMLTALRQVLGDRASVSVPQGEGIRKEEWQWHKDLDFCLLKSGELRAELDYANQRLAVFDGSTLEEALDALEHLASFVGNNGRCSPHTVADLDERIRDGIKSEQDMRLKLEAKLRAELEKTHAELEACKSPFETRADGRVVRKDRWEEAFRAVVSRIIGPRDEFEVAEQMWSVIALVEGARELREQHEALRAAADDAHGKLYWVRDDIFRNVHANPGERLMYSIDVVRALLKPASAEAEPVQRPPPESAMVEPNEALRQAVRMAEREVHVPERYRTESAMVPASLQPLTARVERLEQLAALAISKADTALEALDARKGAP